MASRGRTGAAMESLVETTQGSYEAVVDHTVALQERNVRFAQGMIETLGRECRQHTDANLAMTQELFERAEKQCDALQKVVEESLGVWADLLYAPLYHYKEGPRAAGKTTG